MSKPNLHQQRIAKRRRELEGLEALKKPSEESVQRMEILRRNIAKLEAAPQPRGRDKSASDSPKAKGKAKAA